jgi:hypothetical protein
VFRERRQPAPGIVLFRVQELPPAAFLGFLRAFFAALPTLRGYFTVASPGRFRQIPFADEASGKKI